MPTVYNPTDNFVSPIIVALANIAQTQITGLNTVWQQPPDGVPEDSDLVIPPPSFEVLSDTNARLYVSLKFSLRYVVRRGDLSQNIQQAYSYIPPFLQAYSSWTNQSLGGLTQSVTVKNGGVSQVVFSGIPVIALLINLDVRFEYLIPVS